MAKFQTTPTLSFVWQPVEITRTVIEMARQTSTGAIFDISDRINADTINALKSAGASNVRVSAEDMLNDKAMQALQDAAVTTVWVACHPLRAYGTDNDYLNRLQALSARFRTIPICGDPGLLARILDSAHPLEAVALKGSESAGFGGRETIGILYASWREMSRGHQRCPDVMIWGGVATPEAAAAFICSGAKGIVFESLHWQTDLVKADDTLKQRLSKLRPEHTVLLGQSLDTACRFFDKGNSQAVKDLRQVVDSCFACDPEEAHPRAFVRMIKEKAVPALNSTLGRNELIAMGPEAAFAPIFAERFGRSTHRALAAFQQEVERLCWEAPRKLEQFVENAAARAMGTRYPILQGAMTWVSDIPEFAEVVADAGGLPALALGLKGRADLENEFKDLKDTMGSRPYAVNFIALPENPHLKEQLDWIEALCPPFAVIAAGDPTHARRLQKKGIQMIYVASSDGLIRMALEAGIRFIILEGDEAGGHVGEHSTLTLTQIALELKRQEPDLFRDRYLVVAGGIYNRETAFRALMLGADAIQMGTAYLATREVVTTGALRPLYQRLVVSAQPGCTAVSGESVGLRVRSLNTPMMEAICTLEREWASGRHDEASFRQRLESLSANSLLLAARGVKQPRGKSISEEVCMREGQFMSGAIAGAVQGVQSVAELHRSVAESPLELTLPQTPASRATTTPPIRPAESAGERIAITAMALVNSLGNTPQEIWNASMAGRSGIIEIPRTKWDHDLYFDPDPRARGKTYCNVGAFQHIDISRKALGIAPQDFRSMADSTRLTLWLADQVIQESGLLESGIPSERISVLVSQNSGEAAGTITDLVFDVYSHDIIQYFRELTSLTPELEAEVRKKIRSGRLTVDDTTLLGRLNCAAGGFISNRYGLRGPSYSVSAACATGLVALYSAIQMIQNGHIDAAVVGGGEESLKPSHYLEFSALKALAMLSGGRHPAHESSRPFDATRDGMVLGEGGGMVVIERESTAKKRGVPIHGYITGMGASNNDQGMVESLAETQLIALQSSFRDTGYGPDQVDLVECHATSTVQGDVEEIKALNTLFNGEKRTNLTSFKSQIGHTLGASGLNSLIRGVTAMQAGVYPATPTYRKPDPQIDLEKTGFRIPTEPVDWPQPEHRPRRLQVNAFGFGGANYVVQVEQCREASGHVLSARAASPEPLPEPNGGGPARPSTPGVTFWTARIDHRPYRMGVVAASKSESRARLTSLLPNVNGSHLSDKTLRIMARKGIYAAASDQPTPPLAFVFAGQGSQYIGMGQGLYRTFPEIRACMDKVAAVAEYDLLDLLFNSTEEDLQKTRWQQPALYTMELAMVLNLMALGVRPVAMAGHSLGELVALGVAGVFSHADGLRIVNKRAQCMDKAAGLRDDPGTMVAVNAPMDYLEKALNGIDGVYFTNFNSPLQVVLGGDTEPLLALTETIKKSGFKATPLKVSMAFHSPIMKVIREEMGAFVADIKFQRPQIPVISNTTRQPYPDDPDRIRDILMAHLESPVHWNQNVTTLWQDFGIRHFVEIGPKDTLCNLVSETLDEALCYPTCLPENEVRVYQAAIARLYAFGHLNGIEAEQLETAAPDRLPAQQPPTAERGVSESSVKAVVQREINHFILESFGKIIKPQIVEAVRKELDPGFTGTDLDQILGEPSPEVPTVAEPSPVQAPQPRLKAEEAEPAAAATQTSGAELKHEAVDYLEQVIQIIMDATGYERDEIEPDMDIRQDLAIRSSRLPVIMDDVERRFGITVTVEDFVGLRTVKEIATCIEGLAGRSKAGPTVKPQPDQAGDSTADTAAPPRAGKADTGEKESIERLVFQPVELSPSPAGDPLKLGRDQQVAVFALNAGSELVSTVSGFVEQQIGGRILHLDCSSSRFDLRTAKGTRNAARHLADIQALAGLILVTDTEAGPLLENPDESALFLTGFFDCIKVLMASDHKAFSMVLGRRMADRTPEVILAEGITGMFLSLAHEYPSFLFRSLTLDNTTDPFSALAFAMDTGNPIIELFYDDQKAFSMQAKPAPLSIEKSTAGLQSGNVIVISGGAKGVTYRIAQALAPFKPQIILLGRSELNPAAAYNVFRKAGSSAQNVSKGRFTLKSSKPEKGHTAKDPSVHQAGLDIARNVSRLSTLGLKVSYYACDVADARQVSRTLEKIVKHYGRIDGIIHGAGLIRDGFMENMTSEDFKTVLEVKLLGAWNLYQAARNRGLRFFTALSSLVAIQGNIGQANYSAANRAMAAMLSDWPNHNKDLVSKAIMLPPIEGTGMAEDPEVKALMKLKGLSSAFVHADELAQIVCRELHMAPPQPSWISVARTFPDVRGTLVTATQADDQGGPKDGTGICFEPHQLPMIGTVEESDLVNGKLIARREFSQRYDLWIEDHKPFPFLKHPLVSGIMAVETFFEAAQLLYPQLQVQGVRHLTFEDILECPVDTAREVRIHCIRNSDALREVCCDVRLESLDLSPAGRKMDRWSTNYRGQVLLGPSTASLTDQPEFTIKASELQTPALTSEDIQASYADRTGLKGRYRVLEQILGIGHGLVKGTMQYRPSVDIAGMEPVRYCYSPYLLEALMHLIAFYEFARQKEPVGELIPAGIEELRFSRTAVQGERIALEARQRKRDKHGVIWDARAVDQNSTTVMQLTGMRMNRYRP